MRSAPPGRKKGDEMSEDHREMRWEVNATPKIIGALYRDLTWEKAQSEGMTRAEFIWGKTYVNMYVPEPLPPGMPKDEAAQVYALCRLFRL
jgi:hypothetical protein